MQVERNVTQAEIDAAIVACLRIFAARGRQLRLQREQAQADEMRMEKETADNQVGGSAQNSATGSPTLGDIVHKN
jgi:hypothetical protein